MGFRARLAERLFGPEIRQRVKQALDDAEERYYHQLSASPQDRPWWQYRRDLTRALDAWRTPLAFRIVTLTTDFAINEGLVVHSRIPRINSFVDTFWNHPQNRIDSRLARWSDELTRSGELFLVLSTNSADNMSYVREVPATQIDKIDTAANDRERELRFHETTANPDGHWWTGPAAADALDAPQLMLHYTVNRPVGAIRGEGDLVPVLPWLERYTDWLEDRARINKFKAAFLWLVKIKTQDPEVLARKRAQYKRPPPPGSILVLDESETWEAVQPTIGGDDATSDGLALRRIIAAGVGIPLHYLSEPEGANRATAAEMAEPTRRKFARRRNELGAIAVDLVTWAARRKGVTARDLRLYWQPVAQIDPLAPDLSQLEE